MQPAVAGFRTGVGVDLQGDIAVVVCAERRGRGIRYVTAAAGESSPAGAEWADAPVMACLACRESFTRRLEAPYRARGKAIKVFPTLLDIQLPFALEACTCTFLQIRCTRQGVTSALAVGARLTDVERRLETFRSRGFDPVALDQQGLALWTQSLRERPVETRDLDVLRVVVWLAGEESALVVGCGTDFLNAHAVRSSDAAQMARLLRTYQEPRGGRVVWLWAGPEAADAARIASLNEALSADWPGEGKVHAEPGAFLARALATRALLPGPLRCNLRTGLLSHPALLRRSCRLRTRAAVLLLLAGFLLIGASVAAVAAVRRQEARLDREFRTLADRLAGHPIGAAKGEQAIRIVRDAVSRRTERLLPFRRAFQPSLLDRLLPVLREGRALGLKVEALSASDPSLVLRGSAPDWARCDEMVAALRRLGFTVDLQRQEALSDERIPFVFTCGADHD